MRRGGDQVRAKKIILNLIESIMKATFKLLSGKTALVIVIVHKRFVQVILKLSFFSHTISSEQTEATIRTAG